MIFEYLPDLSNLTDYLLHFDVHSLDLHLDLNFTEFQLNLLKLFSAIICVILALIGVFWLRYGEVISERFIRPSKCAPRPAPG